MGKKVNPTSKIHHLSLILEEENLSEYLGIRVPMLNTRAHNYILNKEKEDENRIHITAEA